LTIHSRRPRREKTLPKHPGKTETKKGDLQHEKNELGDLGKKASIREGHYQGKKAVRLGGAHVSE